MNKLKLSKRELIVTICISILAVVASLLGLFSSGPYSMETTNWLMQARGQDIGNILAVFVLLVGAFLAKKGSAKAYFVWLGSLFYLLYAYIIYAMAVHFNSLFLVYVAIVGITFFTILCAIVRDIASFKPQKANINKFVSITLIVIGGLFALLWLKEIFPALVAGTAPQSTVDAGLMVNPVHVLDLSVVLPAFIATGYWALKGKKVGLYLLAPWLTFSVLMATSIVAAMVLAMANGSTETLPPMVIVSVVALVSLAALISYLKDISNS